MPDATLAKSLLATAKSLTTSRASQAKLRRAVSTAYYSVFHALAKCCADSLVGSRRGQRSNKAWVEIYRGLAHGPCKNSCADAHTIDFPIELKNFADVFVQLQEARERADYDPTFYLSRADTQIYISWAEASLQALDSVSNTDKTAFAAWVLVTTRGAQHARKLAKAAPATAP